MSVKWMTTAVLYILLLPIGAIPQTPSSDLTVISQRLDQARGRQKEASDLPTIDIAGFTLAATAPEVARSAYFRQAERPSLPSVIRPGVTEQWTIINRRGVVPALPVEQSDIIVRGVVDDARAFLTDDHTAVYSTFAVRVEAILKENRRAEVRDTVVALRRGGALRHSSGVLRTRQSDQLMPVVGGTYVLFLKRYSPDDPGFLILAGYRVDGQAVSTLDLLPEALRYEGASEASLLTALKDKLADEISTAPQSHPWSSCRW